MKIIFLSISGDGLALAYKLAREGEHEVIASILKPFPGSDHLYENVNVNVRDLEGNSRRLFQVFPKQKIGQIIEEDGNKSLIIFDNNGFGKMADRLRIGKKMTVLGGGSINDRLEYDRDFGFNIMKEHGIDLPESKKFSDWGKAIQFAKENRKRWVIKVSGQDLPSNATRVPDSPEHTIEVLKEMQSKFQGKSFELQEHKDGIIVEVEGWFNGEKFLEPLNLTFEKKKCLTGDLGHNVGCATNVVVGMDKGATLGEKLLSMSPFLKKNHFFGPISINYIVSSDGKAYGLEFTPRLGYDAIYTLLPLLYQEPGRFFSDVATGRSDQMPLLDNEIKAVGVNFRYSPVDYPDYEPREAPRSSNTQGVVFPKVFPRGLSIGGVNSRNIHSLWFYDVMGDEKGRPVTAGSHGILGCCVQADKSVNVASERAYDILRNIHVDGMEYRTDAGNDVDRNLKILSPLIESKNKIVEKEDKQSLNKTSVELPENQEIEFQTTRSQENE